MAKGDVLVRLKADTSSYNPNIARARKTLNDFKEANLTLGGVMKSAASTLTKFAGGFSALSTAVKVAKDAFMQSEGNIDEWGRTVEGAKGAYDVFLQTINSGNWSNFFSNLTTAIKGARDLYDSLDRLGSIKSNNQAAIAILQQQIAQLRLAKQEGKDVDAQIKSATEQLRRLQNQGIAAGKQAGHSTIINTIRNRINANSTTGVRVSEGTLRGAAGALEHYGQNAFDKYRQNYEQLTNRGMEEVVKYDALTRQYHTEEVFNLSKLTKEEQKQWLVAEAITQRETEIQNGLAIYAQAVNEGTAASREEFKGNRYAMTGKGGGRTGGKGGKGSGMVSMNLANINATANPAAGVLPDLTIADKQYSQLGMLEDRLNRLTEAQARFGGVSEEAWQKFQVQIEATDKEIRRFKGEKVDTSAQRSAASWEEAASAMSNVSSAMSQIEDPAAKVMGYIAQAIAAVAAGAGQAISAKDTTASGWAWIGAAAAITAQMVAIISTIHSATGYARGGVIQGNSYSGDNQIARVNAGETILTRAQAGILASSLEHNGGSVAVQPYVDGEKVFLGVNNHVKRSGQGEIVTTGMLRKMGLM